MSASIKVKKTIPLDALRDGAYAGVTVQLWVNLPQPLLEQFQQIVTDDQVKSFLLDNQILIGNTFVDDAGQPVPNAELPWEVYPFLYNELIEDYRETNEAIRVAFKKRIEAKVQAEAAAKQAAEEARRAAGETVTG